MTSNLGSELLQEALEDESSNFETTWDKAQREVLELLKKTIRPEFLNRIDEIVVFKPLKIEEVRQIVVLQLERLTTQLSQKHIDITFTPKAIDYLAEKGYDPLLGARPVKRAIQKLVINQLSVELIKGTISQETKIEVDEIEDNLVFKRA
jgi:ATP-dependent Clp protease ATP-binding subunit ClpB